MGSVGVNAPKSPVTKGSNGIAAATVPNVCKMPGPPAPFVPTPLPNIGRSSDSPKKYSKKVKFEKKTVAIKGATFKSKGDVASKGTGGGLISAATHGVTSFVGPGSFDVKVEGKNVQLLSDPMLNNGAGSGNPPNAATLAGILQPMVAAAIEKNPGNANVCGAGQHVEKVYFPDVPKDEVSVRGRLARVREIAQNAEDRFEAHAAQFNYEAGHIDHGKSISRELTPDERAAGHHPDSQKVLAVCSECGYRREIDHATKDGKETFEAKVRANAIQGGDQRRNNAAFAAKPGHSAAYKAPNAGQQTIEALRDQGLGFIAVGRP